MSLLKELMCRQTGARLIGSRATAMIGRAAGLPESQLLETKGREDSACGKWTVRGIPSLHSKVICGRVSFPGDIASPPNWPPRIYGLKHGLVLNWLIVTGELRVMHIDAAYPSKRSAYREYLRASTITETQKTAPAGRGQIVHLGTHPCFCYLTKETRVM